MRLASAICGCVLAACVAPSSGLAAVTIGGDVGVASGTAFTCSPGTSCTQAQVNPSTVGPVQQVRSPIDGVITRWRVVGGGTVSLQVITTADGINASATATSSPATLLNGQPNSVRLPIQAQQLVGGSVAGDTSAVRFHTEAGYGLLRFWQPRLGGSSQTAYTGVADTSLLLNADVEADADRDNYGDESQDQCPTDASTHGLCNDNFVNAQTITGSSASIGANTRGATREPQEPDHCVTASDPGDDCGFWIGDHTVWYRWTAPASGPTTIDTCAASIDSILAVYTGEALNALTRVVDDNNNCLPDTFGSKVSFGAVAGTTYQIAVGDAGGAREANFTLHLVAPEPPQPPPNGGVDKTPPGTSIAKGPKKKVKTKKRKAKATFELASDDPSASFECKLDNGEFAPCPSPFAVKVKKGKHTFQVRARDSAGNVDGTPATQTWTVKRKN